MEGHACTAVSTQGLSSPAAAAAAGAAAACTSMKSVPLSVAMHVEEDSLLIGRHIHHSAFSLADKYFSQSDEDEVGQ
jgi:hypothetical protein